MKRPLEQLVDLPLSSGLSVDGLCDRFESEYRAGAQPRIENYLGEVSSRERPVLLTELLRLEIELRVGGSGDATIQLGDYRDRFPDAADDVEEIVRQALGEVAIRSLTSSGKRPAKEPASGSGSESQGQFPLPYQLGAYLLESEIGRGGMGTVYLAVHQRLERPVAIKLMRRERSVGPELVARFQREMRLVAKLQHPNIVMAYDAGEVDGLNFLVMEHLLGWDLSSVCRCCGPLPISVAATCIRQAALGLQHVYEHGLVHRDIKPSNLLLTAEGTIKLLDLGLAMLRSDTQEEPLTRESAPMGTIEYMAPEQARNPHGVDIRADLYSLGCTLFKLLSSASPFSSIARGPVELLAAHLQAEPADIRTLRPETPAAIAELLQRLLRKTPPDRPQTPGDVAEILAPFSSNHVLLEFATALQSMSNLQGRLPVKATPAFLAATAEWNTIATHETSDRPRLSRDETAAGGVRRAATGVSRRTLGLTAVGAGALVVFAFALGLARGSAGTDLLLSLDLSRSVISGDWQRAGDALVSPGGGTAAVRISAADENDFRLEWTVQPVEGSGRWMIVNTGEPRFAVRFAPMLQLVGSVSPENRDDPAAHEWIGDWGDLADSSPRRFVLTVLGNRIELQRNGERIVEAAVPLEGEFRESTVPAALLRRPGIYLATTDSQFRFAEMTKTRLP